MDVIPAIDLRGGRCVRLYQGDYTRETVNAYGTALPNFAGMEGYTASQRAVFVIDKEGVIKFKWVGENPGVEPNYDEVQQQVDQLN